MQTKRIIFYLLCLSFALPGFASAHNTRVSLEKAVGEYTVDIGYNPLVLEAKDPASFDFSLLLKETGEQAEFSDIWVRVVQDKQTFFATGISKPDFGNATMVYTFPEGGAYELNIRFQNKGEALAEVSFPLTVEKTAASAGSPGFVWLVAGLFGGAMAGFFARAVRKRKEKTN